MRRIQYSDQAAVAANQNIVEKTYWLETLAGEQVKSHFPYDNKESGNETGQNSKIAVETFRFPGDLFQMAMKVSSGIDLKLHMILVTGLIGLLEKYTAAGDIIIGSPILKQEEEADFINTLLVFRTRLSRQMTFRELLIRVKETIITATQHQNFPLEVLPELLNLPLPENSAEFPLFDVALLLENVHDKAYLKGIHGNMLFSFRRTTEHIIGNLEYNSFLYRKETVKQVINHYIRFLEKGLSDLSGRFVDIDILSKEERYRLLKEFNNNEIDFPRDKTFHQLFEDQVEKKPENIAAIGVPPEGQSSGKEKSIRYYGLNVKSNRLARVLRAKGVIAETIVAIMAERSLEMIVGVMAVLKAGGAYLPIDPAYPTERIDFMLRNSRTPLLITQHHLRDKKKVNFDGEVIEADDEGLKGIESGNPDPVSTPGNLVYVIYTSGSTGKPKGVMVEHRHFVNIAFGWQQEYRLQEMEVNLLQMVSFSFDVFAGDLARTFLNTGKMVITPSLAMAPESLYELIKKHQVTLFESTPSYIVPLMEYIYENNLEIEHLKLLILGSDTCAFRNFKELIKRFGKQMRIVNSYGVTETTIDSSYFEESKEADIPLLGNVPIGKPLPNVKFYVLDPDGKLLPPGASGELYIGGESVSRGYLSREELSNERFSPDPFIPGQRMYKTGDRVRWLPDGNGEFLGRLDSQIKIRGYRIELGEIESQLMEQDDIKEAVVVEKKEENGDKYLCGYIVSDRQFNASELREYLGQKLPDYMVPWFFIQMDQLPLTPNGKIDRKVLPDPESTGEKEYVAPRNQVEKSLVPIWSRVLGVETGNIGIDTDFFDLGGNSLKAIVMSGKIHKKFNAKVSLTDIFKLQTIRSLAEFIKGAEQDIYASIEPAAKQEYYPLSSAQKRIYIVRQLDPESTGYNMPFTVIWPGEPGKKRLEETVKKLIKRHESLRTSFEIVHGEPVQKIHDEVGFAIAYYQANEEEAKKIIKGFVSPFELEKAPLLRVALINVTGSPHVLIAVDIHHIITDAVSQPILVQELAALGHGEKLPPLRLQYKDYSQWQNREYQQGTFKSQQDYWLESFAGELPLLNLPTDFPRPLIRSYDGSFVKFTIDREKTTVLKELAGKEGGTLQMIMLAILNILLAKVSGQEDIIIGIPISGRKHADLENIIGIFVNTLAVRNFPTAEKCFHEFFSEVKEKSIRAYENQDYPFEDLVGKVWVKRDTVRNPLFDVMFEVQTVAMARTTTVKAAPYRVEDRVSKMDIDWFGIETQNQLFFTVYYRTKLFKIETIEKLIERYMEIVKQVLENRQVKVRDIAVSHHYVPAKSFASQVDHGEFEF